MTDPARCSDNQPDTNTDISTDINKVTGRPAPPGVPRWVKVAGIVAAISVLALVAIMFAAGGEHGPGRHARGEQSAVQIGQRAAATVEPSRGHHTDWYNG